jgi:hypothetical protein
VCHVGRVLCAVREVWLVAYCADLFEKFVGVWHLYVFVCVVELVELSIFSCLLGILKSFARIYSIWTQANRGAFSAPYTKNQY